MSAAAPKPTTGLTRPLRVVASGVCCSVGNSTKAASAAIRARLNHFRQGAFVDQAGEMINVAMLDNIPVWGQNRLQHMYRVAMSECLGALSISSPQLPPILLIGSERSRGIRFHQGLFTLLGNNRPDEGYDPRSVGGHFGKAGIAEAILNAGALFDDQDPPEYVIIAGIDSFLDGASIEHFLAMERIRCSTNPDGFIPGEAAAAIILSPLASGTSSLWIEGVGIAHETATPLDQTTPLRATGMTTALRSAVENAGRDVADYRFHASAISGEQWHFKEAALAMDRVMTHKMSSFPHRLVAQSVGEIGAAFGPLMLAWIGAEMQPDDLGECGLLHFSNDNGQRTALAVQLRA